MKLARLTLCLVLLLAVWSARPAAAVIGTIDDVPAATLLLPYFEVDVNDPLGTNTLFSINNASASAVLAHVVIWSDLSVPVLDFNIYLTGYDVQTVNLRDIIVNGKLPRTASDLQDPADVISPQGQFSQDITFASCTGQLPPPDLPTNFIDHLKNALTGQPSSVLGNLCAGRALGDHLARGYVTVDTVNNCTLRFPGDSGYFLSGGTGDATNQNVLWGDYFYISSAGRDSEGETLVHIEASGTNPETSVAGQYTYYGRYVAWTAIDNREPLATNFAARYVNGGGFRGGTSLVVWRDSKVNQGAFTCPATAGVRPVWYPLGYAQVVIFDEQENPSIPTTFPISPQPPTAQFNPFPAETQLAQVNGASLPVPFPYGWLFLDLNTSVAAAGNNPPEDPAAAQAFVSIIMSAEPPTAVHGESQAKINPIGGRYSVGFDAVKLDSAIRASHAGIH
jgi:hypothetical protein